MTLTGGSVNNSRGVLKKMYKNDWGSGNYTYNIDWGVQYLRESLNVTPV